MVVVEMFFVYRTWWLLVALGVFLRFLMILEIFWYFLRLNDVFFAILGRRWLMSSVQDAGLTVVGSEAGLTNILGEETQDPSLSHVIAIQYVLLRKTPIKQ